MSGPSERSYNRPIIAVSIKIVHLFRRCTYYPESMVYNHFITLLKEDVSINSLGPIADISAQLLRYCDDNSGYIRMIDSVLPFRDRPSSMIDRSTNTTNDIPLPISTIDFRGDLALCGVFTAAAHTVVLQ